MVTTTSYTYTFYQRSLIDIPSEVMGYRNVELLETPHNEEHISDIHLEHRHSNKYYDFSEANQWSARCSDTLSY